MHERIKELMVEAGITEQPAKLKILKNDDGTVTSGGWEYPIEKFAELIVKECAGIVADAVDHREPASTYVGKIKEHFGVE